MAASTIATDAAPDDHFIQLSNPHRWSMVWLLFAASMINYFDRATISFAMPMISGEFGMDAATQGLILSAFFWTYAPLQIPVGRWSDKIDLRWLYAGAFTIWSVAQGLMGLATGVGTFILLRMMLGVGESIYLPAGNKVVGAMFRMSERGLPLGLFDFGTRTGLAIEGVLLPWMLKHFGWRHTFMIVGFTALIWLAPWFAAFPKNLRPSTADRAKSKTPPFTEAFVMLARNRNLFFICLGFFCFDYYWYLLLTWLPSYLITKRGMGILQGGFFASLPFLSLGICQPLGGWMADHVVRKGENQMRVRKIIITFAFLCGLVLIPVTSVQSQDLALGLLVFGGLVGLSTANMLVLLQACAPPGKIGFCVGAYNFVGNVAGILAPLVTGILIDRTKSYSMPFMLASILLVLGIFAFWCIREGADQVKPPENET